MADPLVGDELAVGEREGVQTGAVGRQLGQGGVRDEDALLQVHPLQLVAAPRQRLQQKCVRKFFVVPSMQRPSYGLYLLRF